MFSKFNCQYILLIKSIEMKKILFCALTLVSLLSISVFANVPGVGGCPDGTTAVCIPHYDQNDKISHYTCEVNQGGSQEDNDCKK